MNESLKRAMELKDEIIGNRRYFHENPELGFELPLTLERVKNNLEEMGIKYESVGEAGISALIGKPGKTFLIRGDMDALPMAEETDLPFKSKNDYMHACGHDIHAAALLGAARILKEREAELWLREIDVPALRRRGKWSKRYDRKRNS